MHRPPVCWPTPILAASGRVVKVNVFEEERAVCMISLRHARIVDRIREPDCGISDGIVVDLLSAKQISPKTSIGKHRHSATWWVQLRSIVRGRRAKLCACHWVVKAGSWHRLLNADMVVSKLHAPTLGSSACVKLLVVLVSNSGKWVVKTSGASGLHRVVYRPDAGRRGGAGREHLSTGSHSRGASSPAPWCHVPRGISRGAPGP